MGIGYSGAYSVPRLDLGEAFMEFMFNQTDHIGLELMPPFESALREATFSKIVRESILRTVDLKRGVTGNYNRDEFEAEDDSYRCNEYGHEVPLGDVDRRRFRRDFDAESQSAMHAWRRVLFGHELRVRNLIVDTVNFTTGNGLRTDVAVAWSAPQSTILSDARTAIDAIRARTGMEPNIWWVGYKTISSLLVNQEIGDALRHVEKLTLDVIEDNLPRLVGLPAGSRVLVGRGVTNTANKGQAAVLSDIWDGDTWSGFMRVPMGDLSEPGFGRTVLWTDDSPDTVTVEEYREEQRRATIYRARQFTDEKVIDRSFAQLLDIAA